MGSLPPIERALAWRRAPLRLARMAAHSGVGVSSFLTETRLRGMPWARRNAYVMRWSRQMLDGLGVDVLDDLPQPPPGAVPEGGRMVVANHRSMLDILVLLSRFGGHMLSRDDLARWPVIGPLAAIAETLYVDRSSAVSGAASIRAVSDRLLERHTVTVFAEGTTWPDDEVRPFQPGAFVAITRTGGEVLPVGLAYSTPDAHFFQEPFGAHAARVLTAPRIRVAVSTGHAIAVERQTSKALGARTHERVQGLVRRARSLL